MLTQYSFSPTNTRLADPVPLALVCLLSACSSMPIRSTASRDVGLRTRGVPIQDPNADLGEISIEAMALVDTPYRYGGNTPDNGFDCSGLVRYVVQRAAAVNLPRTVTETGRRGTSLDHRDVALGDLAFFNMTGQSNSHVDIYVGQNRSVYAPATDGTVRLEDMTKSYRASRYVGVRRVVTVSSLPDSPAPTAPMTPTPTSPARPIDDDPLGTLACARGVQADSLMSTRGPATVTIPAEDSPIARFATQQLAPCSRERKT